MKYKGIDPNDTEAIKKRNITRRKKQEKTMRAAKQRNYARKEYTQEEKNNDLRNSLFKSISGIVTPQIEHLFNKTPVTTPAAVDESSSTTIILHELEKVRLYLFSFVTELANIKEQIMQVKWEVYRLNHPQEYTNTPLPPPPPPSPPPPSSFPPPSTYTFDRDTIYKGPNKDKGQEFVRRNIAQIIKNMIPQHYMDQMPKEVRDAYINILGVMAPPNDPIWENEQPKDPREGSEPWSFKDVAGYWNSIAEGTKKLDSMNVDLIGEAVKGATEMLKDKAEDEAEANAFGIDDQEKLIHDMYEKEEDRKDKDKDKKKKDDSKHDDDL